MRGDFAEHFHSFIFLVLPEQQRCHQHLLIGQRLGGIGLSFLDPLLQQRHQVFFHFVPLEHFVGLTQRVDSRVGQVVAWAWVIDIRLRFFLAVLVRNPGVVVLALRSRFFSPGSLGLFTDLDPLLHFDIKYLIDDRNDFRVLFFGSQRPGPFANQT